MRNIAGPSLTLARLFDIPVKVHWSFGLLLLFISYIAISNGATISETAILYVYFLSVFLFVVMHEYGHAIAARRYGIITRDIIISPIGGVARLESIPEDPRHELVVAIAGPLVNIAWYVLLASVQLALGDTVIPATEDISLNATPRDFLLFVMLINGTLVLFNMVPAFPMDGGRVLRALTTLYTKDRVRATMIASIIGQVIAAGFIGYGIYMSHYALIFIGVFVIFTARQEYKQVNLQRRLNRTLVADVMIINYPTVLEDERIADIIAHQGVKNFLVKNVQGDIVGALPSLFITNIQENGEQIHNTVLQHIHKSIGFLNQRMTIATAFHTMNNYGWVIALVIDDNRNIIGVVDRDVISNFMNKS